MTHDTPLSPRRSSHLAGPARGRLLSSRTLREHGVSAAAANERCRPGGPWQMLLPGVYLLHAGPPTSDERLHAALLYSGRLPIPAQTGPADAADAAGPREAMITGLAALALHALSCAPPLRALDRIDVLVPRSRRLRSTGCAHIVRGHDLPRPQEVTGLPVAPVPRALADAVAQLTDLATIRRLLTESVRDGHCQAHEILRELSRARLLGRPHVAELVEGLVAEDRAVAEGRLYAMVRTHRLPDPFWHVEVRLPGGAHSVHVDAYWPLEAVALQIETVSRSGEGMQWAESARRREALERMGVTVLRVTPERLRDSSEQQAMIVRTALMTAAERPPAEYVVVSPC